MTTDPMIPASEIAHELLVTACTWDPKALESAIAPVAEPRSRESMVIGALALQGATLVKVLSDATGQPPDVTLATLRRTLTLAQLDPDVTDRKNEP